MRGLADFARDMSGAGASDRLIEIAWDCIVAKREGRVWPEPKPGPINDRCPRMCSTTKAKRLREIIERDGHCCAECGAEPQPIWRRMGLTCASDGSHFTRVHPTDNLEMDHRKPIWAGGDNRLENLWLLCIDCHKVKTSQEASERRRAA